MKFLQNIRSIRDPVEQYGVIEGRFLVDKLIYL